MITINGTTRYCVIALSLTYQNYIYIYIYILEVLSVEVLSILYIISLK